MRRIVQLALLPAVPFLVACPFDNGTEPGVKPDAPTIGAATPGNTTADIAFTPPANSGSASITEYTVTCTAGGAAAKTATGTSSPITVTGMTNGTTYSCSVTAKSSAGTSDASASVTVIPATVPGPPTIGTVTAGNASASVAFTAPSSNGGSVITGYTASCSASGQTTATATATTSPITVNNLTNGTTYACSVVATNARGSSVASATANVTPAGPPGAPTIGAATPGNGQASIAFTPPASDGGSAITTYAAVCTPTSGPVAQSNNTTSPITVTGMTNGVAYACNVRASNLAGGAGPASGNVNVTPVGPPSAPTIGAATAGDAQASIAFTAPTNNGGSAVTGYTVSCSSTGPTRTGSGSASPIVVTGMVNGTAYSCSVVAANAIGSSGSSGTVSVTPRTVPDAPTLGVATAGNASVSITFTAPTFNGGSAITSYMGVCNAPGQTKTGTANSSPVTVSALTNGTVYRCSVLATNVAGNGPPSDSANVTPSNAGLGTSTLCGYSWDAVNTSITNASGVTYTSKVSYTCTSTLRTMVSNQIPDHPAAAKAASGNPNVMSAQTTPGSVSFTLSPTVVAITPKGNVVGWAINGVKFDPATAEICPTQTYCSPSGATYGSGTSWNVEALGQTLFSAGVDGANAHIQPGGAYHYHGMPDSYLTYLNKGQKLTLIGFAVDGFPIYAKWGYTNANDSTSAVIQMTSSYRLKLTIPAGRPDTSIIKYGTFTQDWEYSAGLGHLDECNGRTGVTPEFPSSTYAYYITSTYPYIQRCIKGTAP